MDLVVSILRQYRNLRYSAHYAEREAERVTRSRFLQGSRKREEEKKERGGEKRERMAARSAVRRDWRWE